MTYINLFIDTLSNFNYISIVFRILLAAILGGYIGFERSKTGHAAGIRTHALVCLGSSLTVLIGLYSASILGFNNDPMRISAQVISGIGFLGAGQILSHGRSQVTGLTTAAGLWTTASIGLAVGLGFYWAAFVTFLVMRLTFFLFPFLEHLCRKNNQENYYIELNDVSKVNDFFKAINRDSIDFEIIAAKSGLSGHIGLTCVVDKSESTKVMKSVIDELPYVAFSTTTL